MGHRALSRRPRVAALALAAAVSCARPAAVPAAVPGDVALPAPAQVVVEAEEYASRDPDDGAFARAVDARWASGRRCLVAFHGRGTCEYAFELPSAGRWFAWLRYASTAETAPLVATLDGAPLPPVSAPSTGALSGKRAWGWVRLADAELAAGAHRLTLAAAPLRPDCLLFTTAPGEPAWLRPAETATLDAATAAALARPLPPPSADWPGELDARVLPDWFEEARVVLHTRLSPRWRERRAFGSAADAFAALGAPAFVRHVRTAGEGAWWPSAAGAVAPWGADDAVVPGIVARAHDAGLALVAYYRHLEDVAAAEDHPDWACRDDRGGLVTRRTGAPQMCPASPWVEHVETRLLELVERGADAIYLDEFPLPSEGCWCARCRDRFRDATGLEPPGGPDEEDPVWHRYVDVQALTAEAAYLRWSAAVHARAPGVVLLVSTHTAPDLLDRHATDRLARLADAPKTEFPKGAAQRSEVLLHRDPDAWVAPRGARLALGWAWNRDAARGRPPHVWVNELVDEPSATFAAAGLLAWGCVANLDHPEDEIRADGGAGRFRPALALGRRLGPALAGARPVRTVALNATLDAPAQRAGDPDRVRREVLAPTHGAWAALVRARVPAGVATDDRLADGSFALGPFAAPADDALGVRALVLPVPDALDEAARRGVERFERAGGAVVRLRAADWRTPADVEAAGAALLRELAGSVAAAPVRVVGGPPGLQASVLRAADGALLVALSNDFGWVWSERRELPGGVPARLPPGIDEVPPDVAGVHLELPGAAADEVAATELVAGAPLDPVPGAGGARVAVPPFRALAVVRIERSPR